MKIKDYDLITNDIIELFERKIIIWGAGHYGTKIAALLKKANIRIHCFCDRDKEKKRCEGYPVITIEKLKKKVEQDKCLVIVASGGV